MVRYILHRSIKRYVTYKILKINLRKIIFFLNSNVLNSITYLLAGGSRSSVVCRPVAVTQGVPRPTASVDQQSEDDPGAAGCQSPSPDDDKREQPACDAGTTHVVVRPDEDGDM